MEGELEVLHHELRAIRDLAGESTVFAMPASDRMLYAAFYPTGHPVGVRESIGSARPMHASAVGKAYLSALDSPTLDVVLGRLNYSEGTDRAAKGPIELREQAPGRERMRVRGRLRRDIRRRELRRDSRVREQRDPDRSRRHHRTHAPPHLSAR